MLALDQDLIQIDKSANSGIVEADSVLSKAAPPGATAGLTNIESLIDIVDCLHLGDMSIAAAAVHAN